MKNEDIQKTIIINCTSDFVNVNKQLNVYGFNLKRHKLIASLLLFSPYPIRIYIPSEQFLQKKFFELLKIDKNNYLFTKVISNINKNIIVGSLITNTKGLENLEKINQKIYLLDSKSEGNIAIDIIVQDMDPNINISQAFPKNLINDIYFSDNYDIVKWDKNN